MFAGCAHTIRSADIPLLQTGSPLKGIKPKTFAFKEFRDARVIGSLWVGEIGALKQKIDQPVAVVVGMAIRKELERNGHICIDYSPQSKSDFIIEGTVFKYWFYVERGGTASVLTSRFVGNVAVKLTVSNTSPDKGVLIKSYEGESLTDIFMAHPRGKAALVTLSQAQLAMVKEISTDSELIEFLEK
jgi:hypothetical protein